MPSARMVSRELYRYPGSNEPRNRTPPGHKPREARDGLGGPAGRAVPFVRRDQMTALPCRGIAEIAGSHEPATCSSVEP